ncbi:MAG: DNA replication/repair protein RecF [Firmicutes bacterium]|nr:DNA replication/repair protein RecF [Bacillota bacterium]MCL5039139.1 DNA replication/repair protein RecF [Bacillota bacterium]
MIIERLRLVNFRNYGDLNLDLGKGINLFLGKNGQGKTNLLEALYFLSLAESPRVSRQVDLIKWGEEGFVVEAAGQESGLEYTFIAGFEGNRTSYRLNGKEIPLLKVPGRLPTAFFSPDDLFLLKGPPSGRRNYLDRLLFQANPQYRFYHQRYGRIITQRNNLLRQWQGGLRRQEELTPWNQELVSIGSRLIKERLLFLKKLAVFVRKIHRELSGYAENAELIYRSTIPLNNAAPALEEISQAFNAVIVTSLGQEIARGSTLFGPHRDDLSVLLEGRDLRSFGSQGQQRTAVLALKFAEAEFLKSELEKDPVLLLDDVFSELDQVRQNQMRRLLPEVGQVLITSADQTPFPTEFLQGATVFHIESGRLSQRTHPTVPAMAPSLRGGEDARS